MQKEGSSEAEITKAHKIVCVLKDMNRATRVAESDTDMNIAEIECEGLD